MRERAPDRPLEVAADERGLVRVFTLEGAAAWEATQAADWPLPGALGVAALDPRDVQVFAAGDIAAMGLPAFLAEAYGVGADQTDPDRAALEAATQGPPGGPGYTLAVIRSAAFGGAAATLAPARGVRLIGLYAEPQAAAALAPMAPVASARAPGAAGRPGAASPDEGSARVLERFRPDRDVYIRAHLWMAAAGMIAAVVVLTLLGNPAAWVGAPAALLAIAVRGAYLASEELGQRWDLTETEIAHVTVDGLRTRGVPVGGFAKVRRLGSAVQVVGTNGDKLMLKYLADPDAVRARLGRAGGVAE